MSAPQQPEQHAGDEEAGGACPMMARESPTLATCTLPFWKSAVIAVVPDMESSMLESSCRLWFTLMKASLYALWMSPSSLCSTSVSCRAPGICSLVWIAQWSPVLPCPSNTPKKAASSMPLSRPKWSNSACLFHGSVA